MEHRKYNNEPYQVIALHGGPGACGQIAPVARHISEYISVIEPFQLQNTIDDIVENLKILITQICNNPVTIIGHSWGAWLALIYATRYPNIVKKIILIGAPSFEHKYVSSLLKSRKRNLTDEEFAEYNYFMKIINSQDNWPNDFDLKKFEYILMKADSFKLNGFTNEIVDFKLDILKNVWKEAENLRKTNVFINMANSVNCDVTIIHGNKDPHSYSGVFNSLSKLNKNFKFYLLKNCGHYPWFEEYASNEFFEILRMELINK